MTFQEKLNFLKRVTGKRIRLIEKAEPAWKETDSFIVPNGDGNSDYFQCQGYSKNDIPCGHYRYKYYGGLVGSNDNGLWEII